jgi:uncharacterized membrane protein YhfC
VITVLAAVNCLAMLALPAIAAIVVVRRGGHWDTIGIGAAAFVGSQVVHLPLNWLVLPLFPQPIGDHVPFVLYVAVGVTAGLCEEAARYVAFRFAEPDARWKDAIAMGVGHGGVEALILGALALFSLLQLVALSDPAAIAALPEASRINVQAQIDAFHATPPLYALLGVIERVSAMTFHVGASVLVWRAVRGSLALVGLAMVWHATADTMGVWLVKAHGPMVAEAFIATNAALALAWIVWSREDEPKSTPSAPPPLASLHQKPLSADPGATDTGRYEP